MARMLSSEELFCSDEEIILNLYPSSGSSKKDMIDPRRDFLESAYERYSDALARYVRSLTRGDEDDVQDVVQTVFARISALKEPQGVANPEGYLYQSARNLVYERARRSGRERPIFLAPSESHEALDERNPERVALSREQLKLVEKVLAKMPPRRRRIFILLRIHCMPYEEVAKQLGISNAAVQKHMVRALDDCRRSMEGFARKRHSGTRAG